MKKFFALFTLLLLALVMVACGDDDKKDDKNDNGNGNGDEVTLPETISMTEIDQYLFDAEWQFVDVRNFQDQMADGWIRGFEFIPFFHYLEYANILVREDGWSFSESNIRNESALRELFDEDRNIVIICAAGLRAAYVKEALLHLGYENVWNAGALRDYVGDHMVYGDGSFSLTPPPRAWVDPLPEDINMGNIDQFLGRPGTKFFDFRDVYPGESSPMLEIGWIDGFTVIPYFEFLRDEGIIEHPGHFRLDEIDVNDVIIEEMIYVLENIFGDKDTELILMCMSGARSGLMQVVLEELGYTNVWNAGGWGDYEGSNGIYPWCEGSEDNGENGEENGCE